MPPEPYPWDRRDFRKHERSASDPRFGGGFGGVGPPRWRDQQHHNAPLAHPPSYHQNYQQQQRLYSDFRTRSLPPAHDKQAGWHTHPDEGSHVFLPFGSRFSDRNLEEENFRPYRSCSDAGRYVRNSRENRVSFSQKDWRATSWEPFAASTPGRPNTETNDQRLVENNKTSHERNSVTNCPKSENLSQLSDSLNTLEPSCPLEKELQDKEGGNSDELCANGLESTRKSEKENCLASIDWKPLKWSRSGSLSSRGSSLSCSSSSKSVAVDSVDTVAEVQEKKLVTVQSPTAEAAACVMTAAPDSSEETSSRKKPRLGWGEGLAKYEKKKVDSPEDSAAKIELVISLSNIEETVQSHDMNLLDKSPRVACFLDFASPATPSSVGCSSSTGIEEKESCRAVIVDHDTANLSCSPCVVSRTPDERPIFNLEKLELTSFASVRSLICDLLQSDDLSSRGSNFLGANSMNKLLFWKVDALKALEITETEIDSLETELKSLIPVPGVSGPHPVASSLQPQKFHLKPCKEQVEDEQMTLKSENFDSPSSATSKYVGVSQSGDDVYPSQTTQGFVNLLVKNPSNLNGKKYVGNGLCDEENIDRAEYCEPTCINSCSDLARVMDDDICDIYDSILASNRVNANGASEVLNKLLPSKQCMAGSKVSCLPSVPSSIEKKYFMRKQFLRFKEKVLTIKYKLFQHFWIEGRLVSVRKLQAKSHKKLDLIGHKKNRYGRSRICSLANSSRTVPAEDLVDFVTGLLSESSFKPCRNALKMPALILDKKEMRMSRFITSNGLVEDPCAVEQERSMINTWTLAEREVFIDKLATFGKNFRNIASFLDHKTIADCVEFYYKNHKSDCFEKARKKPEAVKQRKSQSSTYLVASGKRWNREAVAASLDILGEASAIAANADGIEKQKGTSRFSLGASCPYKAPRCYDDQSQRSNSLDFYRNEREAVAADVLAGICGSLSSEAMSSCITSSFDPGDGYQDSRSQRVGFSVKRSLNPRITHIVDDECSDESCGEMDPTDWTDVEKSIFIQAVSSYGKDFGMISHCVRTRSRDQCKVFFSKSRKCLGLDLILPGFNSVSGDVDGGGSDIEDASVVETGSITYNEGYGGKTEEDLPSPGWKSSHASNVKSATPNLKSDSKRCEELNVLDSSDPMDTELGVNGLLLDNPPLDDKSLFSGINGQNGATDVPVSLKEIGVMGVSSVAESLQGVEEADDHDLLYGSTGAEKMALIEISDGRQGKNNEGSNLLLAEDKSAIQKVEEKDADSTEVNGTNGSVTNMKSESQQTESASRPSVDGHSSMQVDNVPGCQKKADLLSTAEDTSHIRSLQQDGHMASMNPSTLFSVPIKYQKLSYHNALPSVGINGANDDHCDCQQQHISGHALSDHVEASQILRYPVSVPMMNEEVNGCASCQKTVLHQNASRPDGNLHNGHHAEPLLRKCNSSGHHTKMFEVPHPVHDQTGDQPRPQPSCSSGFEKPSGNGDVKLFGKILVPSQQKQNACGQQTDDNNSQNHKSGSSLLSLKFNNEQNFSFDSSVSKFDRHNYLGSDDIQARNFSFWDGNRMKAGLPPVPDSTLLLSKYPAAFSNYSFPAMKIEHPPPLHGIVTSNDRSLNSVPIYPAKDLCSSNGITDYLKNQEGQKFFTINMKNPQATLFPEMQRQNVFHIGPEMQRQARGLVEMNIGRGVIVGGQCSTVSDPVAAIRRHYAQTEQFSLQAGNIIKDDDTRRSKGI